MEPFRTQVAGLDRIAATVSLSLTLLLLLLVPPAFPQGQDHAMPPDHHSMKGMDMPMDHSQMDHSQMSMDETPPDPAVAAKRLADKRESEFNHHLAGFFVLLAGLFILSEGFLRRHWPLAQYAWPLCFLLSGLFVFLWSDTELWPFGSQSWIYGLSQHAEVRQHKIFAVILLALGFIELQSVRGTLKSFWTTWIFPALAVVGSTMLFFHQHSAGMHGAHHMETMARIQSEHFSYAMAGFGIGIGKGLSGVKTKWQPIFAKFWPTMMIVLGILLMFYRE